MSQLYVYILVVHGVKNFRCAKADIRVSREFLPLSEVGSGSWELGAGGWGLGARTERLAGERDVEQ